MFFCVFLFFCVVFVFYFFKISEFALPGVMLMYERTSIDRKKENRKRKFHKLLIKTIHLRERTLFQAVNFHKQRAITPEHIVRYRPLSNLKKMLRHPTM